MVYFTFAWAECGWKDPRWLGSDKRRHPNKLVGAETHVPPITRHNDDDDDDDDTTTRRHAKYILIVHTMYYIAYAWIGMGWPWTETLTAPK